MGDVFYITAVATQGRNGQNKWVKKYTLSYTMDTTFTQYTEGGVVREFDGNTDRNTVVKSDILEPFSALKVRLIPTDYHWHTSLRWELYGGETNPGEMIKIPKGVTLFCKHLPS